MRWWHFYEAFPIVSTRRQRRLFPPSLSQAGEQKKRLAWLNGRRGNVVQSLFSVSLPGA